MKQPELLYPIGQQDFRKIREEGKIYVDKTAIIYDLVKKYSYIFLSRPRRFGKSLLLSTIKSYFEGEKELFKGLAVYDLEKEWRRHPVLHLMLSSSNPGDHDSLKTILDQQFRDWENKYEVRDPLGDLSARFRDIIYYAEKKTGEKVVILIDEYDNALVNTIHRDEVHEKNRELLKSIYSNLKDMDAYIRFGMLTGVSRFSRAGIFSGLNNLSDITFVEKYSTICGFSEEEIRKYLWRGVEEIGKKYDTDADGAMQLLKANYDGYHFSQELIDVYNPFSLLNALAFKSIENYWIHSGTPEFLIKALQESHEPLSEIFNSEADSMSLQSNDAVFESPVALLYQTGYLTIKGYDRAFNAYQLGVPNKEVREGFFSVLWTKLTGRDRLKSMRKLRGLQELLESGDAEGFMEGLRSFMAGIPYHLTSKAPEVYFENNLFVIFQLMGVDVRAEDETSWGRIDLTVKTDKYIYIIEIKVDKPAEEALRQIEKKDYALKYKLENKKVVCIGATFDSHTRNLEQFLIHRL